MNDTPMIAPMFPENEPTENSTLDELAAYALVKQGRIIDRERKNAEDLWLMGQALEWAKAKVGHGEWEKWWKAKGFTKTYVWQARKLYENATLEEVNELGMTEALRKFAVVSERKQQPGTKATSRKIKDEVGVNASPAKNDAEDQTETPDPNKEDDGGDQDEAADQPSDDLADEEEREFKKFEESIRKLTPKARAVVIHHALELLRDELDRSEVDQELQQTLEQIAELAEELKGESQQVEAA